MESHQDVPVTPDGEELMAGSLRIDILTRALSES